MKAQVSTVDVFTEREFQDGRQPEFIDQLFSFRITYVSSAFVYFRLSAPTTDGVSNSPILQILPGHLASLHQQLCRWDDISSSHPQDARQRLGGASDLTRLRFHLRSGMQSQIIVPKDDTGFKTFGSAARRVVHLFDSLAASPSFCVYLPRHKLSKSLLQQYAEAVEQFPRLEGDGLLAYQRKVDPKRLYEGKGGRILAPNDYEDGSRPDGERSRSSTPVTTESNGSTVAFDIVPRREGPPPQYGECVTGSQKPRATSNDEADSVESPHVDRAPPEYSVTEQPCSVQNVSKRPRQCGNEDALLYPCSKKILSTTASTRNTRGLDAKPRLEFEDADIDVGSAFREWARRFEYYQEQQNEQLRHEQNNQLKKVQDELEKLRRRNAELEKRQSDMENDCAELTRRLEEAEEDIESIRVDTSALEDVGRDHEDRLAEISGEVTDLLMDTWSDSLKVRIGDSMKEHMNDLAEEYLDDLVKEYVDTVREGSLAESLRDCIRKKVTSQMDILKAQVSEALH
ncbi:hypothetical protein CORC01_10782 [Colletotrichum orchidophilum]|uniref:Uncharacterized protein n=1 Tax=Colletotrichum orchidophilum TaxID=1209926 RepID=A0A1G4AXR9_9PEZI|nr:uncharacterized protein CORC01_10782 [Colletotrichum orchidophilum]OHE93883.1 hypothetical protein CORC01_10782 [Colletotrichum orchidophilum]